jgi:hypothetical protein
VLEQVGVAEDRVDADDFAALHHLHVPGQVVVRSDDTVDGTAMADTVWFTPRIGSVLLRGHVVGRHVAPLPERRRRPDPVEIAGPVCPVNPQIREPVVGRVPSVLPCHYGASVFVRVAVLWQHSNAQRVFCGCVERPVILGSWKTPTIRQVSVAALEVDRERQRLRSGFIVATVMSAP